LAAPVHPPLPGLGLSGFNHACGIAVDSEGDVYVSSAGESKVKVFDPAHHELAFIANANEPCGLALDSKGNLYVSESKTGNVVKYAPTAYPFSGTPTYGAPIAIDSSGNAKGITVDPFDDRLYVAEGARVAMYNAEGTPGIDEEQFLSTFNATGGTYKLKFKGQETGPIAFNAANAEVQTALEALSTVGTGNISVTEGEFGPTDHRVTFKGALGGADVEQLQANTAGLTGSIVIETKVNGFNGHIGEGSLTNATGVAAYTYAGGDRYLFVADPAGAAADRIHVFGGNDIRTLKLRKTIEGVDHDGNPETPDQKLGFGPVGAYLSADQGSCPPSDQACTAGHFFVYDDAHEIVDELEAGGRYLTQISHPEFEDAESTAIAVDRSGGPDDGVLYVTSGVGAGAGALAFGPLPAPSRPDRPKLSFKLENACGVAVDFKGNRYVAADVSIRVYSPGGTLLTTIPDADRPCDLAVDSAGNVYALDRGTSFSGDEKAVYFTPALFPPGPGTNYSGATTVATAGPPYFSSKQLLFSIGINPANDHVFVSQAGQTIELDSVENGSGIKNSGFASGLGLGERRDLGACETSGNVYVAGGSTVFVLDPTGSEILARIGGEGSPKGAFGTLTGARIAVDEANCHVLVFESSRGVAEEYEPSGTFLTEFGAFNTEVIRQAGIAVDNSGGPNDGNAYVAFFEDLSAFGPLAYGEPPVVLTTPVSGVGTGKATLHGTVDPRGFELEDCHFEYTTEADFQANGFSGALSEPCVPDPTGIGSGTGPVSVSGEISGLGPDQRYRFRLVAENKYGVSEGVPGLFGPPLITTKSAQPVSYSEATLRARIDPSGLATKYRFEYGTSEGYGQSTPTKEIVPGPGPIEVQVPIFGLAEGTTYHFRLVAENEAKAVEGPDQSLRTPEREEVLPCPNAGFRTGRSASLPDCRAYELVTPADTRGATPYATDASGRQQFNNWLVTPRGEAVGERLSYFLDGTLPGFEGNGRRDGYRAERSKGEGPHPMKGWKSVLFGPSYVEAGGEQPPQQGVALDQLYSFWRISPLETFEGTLEKGRYLRTPAGFEPIGQGSLGTDLDAEGRFITAGAEHVILESKAHLEPSAPPAGTTALYDRTPGGPTHVVSLLPGEATPAANASYVGATEDGAAILFRVDGALYLRRGNTETVKVADAPNTFAGISEDGERVFYTDVGDGETPGDLFSFEVDTQSAVSIAANSVFVNVSADGSHAFFTSMTALTGAEENDNGEAAEAGKDNLYFAEEGDIRFLAILDHQDLVSFDGNGDIDLLRWTDAIAPGATGFTGRAQSPTRSTPDGKVLVFQSHADLTSYESGGQAQTYRYDTADGSLRCVSCDPSGAPPSSADAAALQSTSGGGSTVSAATLIPNVTNDGGKVFFQSSDPLLSEDANDVQDVYEWKAHGAEGCSREGGCLALISSGQGEQDNYLYSMTPDGHDVFFTTIEKLVGADIPGSPSIYDARVEGGIPDPPVEEPCQADACQGQGSQSPALPTPARTGSGDTGNEAPPKRRCPKGKRRVVRHGKARCVKRHAHKRRANQHRDKPGVAR
jgi:hypothetical protein